MKEPRRWLEDGSDAPPGARELLRHARPTPPIDRRTLSLTALLVAKLAASPAAAAALPLGVKLLTSAAVLGMIGAFGADLLLSVRHPQPQGRAASASTAREGERPRTPATAALARQREEAPPFAKNARAAGSSAARPAPAAAEARPSGKTAPLPARAVSAKAVALEAAALEAAAPPASHPARYLRPAPRLRQAAISEAGAGPAGAPELAVNQPDPLAREVKLLDRARAALRSDPERALLMADDHAATFPGGVLAAERELIAVDALARLGRRAAAARRGAALLRRFPETVYRQRLRALLDVPD